MIGRKTGGVGPRFRVDQVVDVTLTPNTDCLVFVSCDLLIAHLPEQRLEVCWFRVRKFNEFKAVSTNWIGFADDRAGCLVRIRSHVGLSEVIVVQKYIVLFVQCV